EGQLALDNYDIYADVGGNTGVVKSFVTEVTDGNLTIEFIHVVENPAVKAIEILPVGSEPGAALVADQSSVNFGEIAVDSSSDVELITLTHTGEAGQPAINITQAALSGANSAEFVISNFAPLTL